MVVRIKKLYPVLFSLIIIWIVSDLTLTHFDPLKYSPYFEKNDFEITQLKHPEKSWDKVVFGSSIAINSFNEELSGSGYINAGICYGTVSDIYQMLSKNIVDIESDLVLILNDISFYDGLKTNPSYLWHKKWYQHYIYFERDRIYPLFDEGIDNVLDGKDAVSEPQYKDADKYYSIGALSDEELFESNEKMLKDFGNCTVAKDCSRNFSELKKLIKYCDKNGIRLRAVWSPWNPKIPVYGFAREVKDEADRIFAENNIEVYDMMNEIPVEYFYDIGHLDYEKGAPYFTKKLDEFLAK